jgi:hypothetical protein
MSHGWGSSPSRAREDHEQENKWSPPTHSQFSQSLSLFSPVSEMSNIECWTPNVQVQSFLTSTLDIEYSIFDIPNL